MWKEREGEKKVREEEKGEERRGDEPGRPGGKRKGKKATVVSDERDGRREGERSE